MMIVNQRRILDSRLIPADMTNRCMPHIWSKNVSSQCAVPITDYVCETTKRKLSDFGGSMVSIWALQSLEHPRIY